MLRKKTIWYLLALIILIPSGFSCSPAKEVEERRNYMIPKKSDMPANSRYKEPSKRKTYKPKSSRSKNKGYF